MPRPISPLIVAFLRLDSDGATLGGGHRVGGVEDRRGWLRRVTTGYGWWSRSTDLGLGFEGSRLREPPCPEDLEREEVGEGQRTTDSVIAPAAARLGSSSWWAGD
jgi:hypothetical protein